MTFNHIVLNIPHSSTIIPVNTWEGDISRCVQKWTDLHTDTLFVPSEPCAEKVTSVIFPVSRFFCDAERLTDDPMEDIGQGINTPYSNSITPPSKHPYTSFMIELNKSIYMNELSDMNPHATQLQNTIQQLYPKLLYSS